MALSDNCECPPMMEACTLDLYKKNIFRITGLPVDATSKEVSRQVQKLQMLEEMGGGDTSSRPAFALAGNRSSEEIREALSRMKEPETRLVDEFFWFWPEEFGASKDDLAIQAMLSGKADEAYQLWKTREESGSSVAQHNMAILYHMYAVDWTNFHVASTLDPEKEEEIKDNWIKAFQRWEPMIEDDTLWDMLKDRVRSLDDEALTTGFVRRMLKQLPEALDRVNAEAALKFAVQGRMDWARYHVDFMRETHQGLDDVDSTAEMVLEPTKRRVDQYLSTFSKQVDKSPLRGAELANELLEHCRPMMNLFDLFHGEDAHQRNELFDKVAETVLAMVISHQKSSGDNKTFVTLLQETLEFASGASIRERILRNISIGEGNLKWSILEPVFKRLEKIQDSALTPAKKLENIQQLVIPIIPEIASEIGTDSKEYEEMMDTVALAFREVSIDAHNSSKDFNTAEKALNLARKYAVSQRVIDRLKEDMAAFITSKQNNSCYFCGVNPSEESALYELPMYGDIVRLYRRINYRSISVPIPRCTSCQAIQKKSTTTGCVTGISCVVIGIIIGAMCDGMWFLGLVGGGVVGFILNLIIPGIMESSSKLKNVKKHPVVKKLRKEGWQLNAPS